MEILLGIFWKLLEEQSEQRIHVLARRGCGRHARPRVGKSDVDRLIEENNARVRVPRIGVEIQLLMLVDPSWTKLEEETGQG